MGNSLLLNRHIDDDDVTAANIYALEQREQKDLAIQLSSSNLFSEMLKLKKTLETASSTRSINDEMHLPLSEKHNRHINVAGFWKNIIAGLDEDTNRRRITLKRLTEQLSTSVELKSIFLETLEKRLGYIGCAVMRMNRIFCPKMSRCYQLPKYQKIVDNGELWYIIPDLVEVLSRKVVLTVKWIKNILKTICWSCFNFGTTVSHFATDIVDRWRKTYREGWIFYTTNSLDHETNKVEAKITTRKRSRIHQCRYFT